MRKTRKFLHIFPRGPARSVPSAAEPDRTLELVREPQPRSFGLCLIGMLPDLAMWCLYRVLETLELILKPCDLVLVTVPSAARI